MALWGLGNHPSDGVDSYDPIEATLARDPLALIEIIIPPKSEQELQLQHLASSYDNIYESQDSIASNYRYASEERGAFAASTDARVGIREIARAKPRASRAIPRH